MQIIFHLIDSQFRLDMQPEFLFIVCNGNLPQICFTICFHLIVKNVVKADFRRNEIKSGFIEFCLGLDSSSRCVSFCTESAFADSFPLSFYFGCFKRIFSILTMFSDCNFTHIILRFSISENSLWWKKLSLFINKESKYSMTERNRIEWKEYICTGKW